MRVAIRHTGARRPDLVHARRGIFRFVEWGTAHARAARTMALKTDPSVFSPEALADESLFDEEEPLTRPGVATGVASPRVAPPRSAKTARAHAPAQVRVAQDPDAEAVAIVNKVVAKVAVAKSLAKIAGSLFRSYADQKMAEIVEQDTVNAVAHVARARHVANAVKEAATHAASLAAARAAAKAQEAKAIVDQAASAMLDHEDTHDDAC